VFGRATIMLGIGPHSSIAFQLGMKVTWAGVPLPEASVPIVMFNQCNFLLFAGGAGMSLTHVPLLFLVCVASQVSSPSVAF